MEVKFVKLGINGEGIGYLDHKPVFCPGVFPNETAEVRIVEEKKNYAVAEVIKMIWRSKERIKTDYPYYIAEGCPLYPMKYEAQLFYKKKLLTEALYKYAHVKEHFVRDVKPSPKTAGYRNAMKLPVQQYQGKLVTGMYLPGTNHFQPIEHSAIQDPVLEKVRMEILNILNSHGCRAFDIKERSGLRYLCMRIVQNEVQCTLVTGRDIVSQELIKDVMNIEGVSSLFQSINTDSKNSGIFGSAPHLLAGKDTLDLKLDDITLAVSPDTFFQLNTAQAENLYQMAVNKIDRCDTLAEAYCGIGAMSLLAHKKAKHIFGIENNSVSIQNAKINAENNKIKNVTFICGDAGRELLKLHQKTAIDCLLADPPRSGMNQTMTDAVLQAKPKKIIYISCNPATLAKNLNTLKHQYHVVTIIPYDMFPHTPLVESITVLERDNYAENQQH